MDTKTDGAAVPNTSRSGEGRRDFDGIMKTFTENCYLETIALGSRSEEAELRRVPRTSPTSVRSPT